MSRNSETSDREVAKKLFKRELFASFAIYYFPLMILMSAIVVNVDFLKRNAGTLGPLLVILFPAFVSITVAFIRLKFVHKVEYKPNLKNFFLFLAVISAVFLIQAMSYSALYHPELINTAIYATMLVLSYTLYRLSKGKTDYIIVAKILASVSPLFILVWSVFAAINRVLYSFIVLAAWLVVFVVSLVILKKGGG